MSIREVIEMLVLIYNTIMNYILPLFNKSEEETEGETPEAEA